MQNTSSADFIGFCTWTGYFPRRTTGTFLRIGRPLHHLSAGAQLLCSMAYNGRIPVENRDRNLLEQSITAAVSLCARLIVSNALVHFSLVFFYGRLVGSLNIVGIRLVSRLLLLGWFIQSLLLLFFVCHDAGF